jgi:polar amino acid transport system permease protein
MSALVESFFNVAVVAEYWPLMLHGLLMTLLLSALSIPAGAAGGLLIGWLSTFANRAIDRTLGVYVDLFRSFPPLVLLILIFYGLPFFGLDMPTIVSVLLAFFLNTSSYFGEIIRAGLQAVPRGQWDGAKALGLTHNRTFLLVVLPQAVRNVGPDLASNTLEVAKLTSVASVVALPELMQSARVVQGLTYNATPLVLAAAIYVALLWPLLHLANRSDKRTLDRDLIGR